MEIIGLIFGSNLSLSGSRHHPSSHPELLILWVSLKVFIKAHSPRIVHPAGLRYRVRVGSLALDANLGPIVSSLGDPPFRSLTDLNYCVSPALHNLSVPGS